MNDEVAVENEKSKGSLVKVVAVAVLSFVVGFSSDGVLHGAILRRG